MASSSLEFAATCTVTRPKVNTRRVTRVTIPMRSCDLSESDGRESERRAFNASSLDSHFRGGLFFVRAVFLQLVEQGLQADPEHLGGARLVVFCVIQRQQNQRLF